MIFRFMHRSWTDMKSCARISRLAEWYLHTQWKATVWQRQSARWHLVISLGVKIEHNVDPRDFFGSWHGAISYARFRQDRVRKSGNYFLTQ